MANKGKNYKIEAEIEKYRAHQNWDKALEVTKNQWSNSKSANGLADLNEVARDKLHQDVVSNLLHGEKELESYLRANPPSEENVGKAKESLASAEKHLRYVSTRCPKEKETLKREAVLLLVKLLFAQARYTDALNEFESISVDALTIHSITNRMLKILAEGLAVKAMCMEKLIDQGVRERTPQAEEMIIKYYEQAGDILLVYLQNRDVVDLNSASPTYSGNVAIGSGSHNTTSDDSIGSILEMAVQKSPLIYIEKGEVSKGVGRFRDLLRAVGSTTSKNLYRLTLARQLAEVLLRGVCSATYPPIALKTDRKRGSLKARQYSGRGMFVPSNEEEEALLLLLIAEAMANREAVLERRPEHKQSRQHSYDNATAVYDLLAIALVRRSNCAILAEALERAMKFSYEEPHVWYQFALSLIETGKFDRANVVLKECHRLMPSNNTILLLQADLCYEKLHLVDDGIALCEKAVDNSDTTIGKSKAYLLLATGYSYKLAECRVKSERELLEKKAYDAYNKSYSLDSYSVESAYRLALHLAQQRRLTEAFRCTRQALRLQPGHMNSLALLSLLFSAEKNYERALEVIKIALAEYPDTFSLLLIKSRLENSLGLFNQSLITCSNMLRLWKKEYQNTLEIEKNRGTGLLERFTDSGSKAFLLVSNTADTGSVRESVAASKVEKALSEVASSYQSSVWPRLGPQYSWSVQAQIWLHLAEIYLEASKTKEAHDCVDEAMTICPLSHLASYMKGRVLEVEQKYSEAKSCFEAALCINPYHVKSMTYLGKTLHSMGHSKLAEKMLRDAVNVNPTAHQAWKELGVVLEALKEFDTASDCLITAINLERSTPVIPFSNLFRMS